MGKIFIVALLTLTIAFGQLTPAQQTLQSFINGVYQENNMTPPTSLVQCFDPTTAQNTVTFIGQILPKIASASIVDLPSIVKQIQAFGKTIPQTVQDCLKNDPNVAPLAAKYGITPTTNWSKLETQIATYLSLHFPSVHKALQQINSSWQGGNYQQAGTQTASLGHQIINQSTLVLLQLNLTPSQNVIQQVLNGLYTENKLQNSTSIATCFTPPSDASTVQFFGTVLGQAASASINQLIAIVKEIQQYSSQLPESVKTCVETNPQLLPLASAYGFSSTTNWNQIATQVINYITFHFSQVQKSIQSINAQWLAQSYYNVGYQFGALGHQVLGTKLLEALTQNSAQNILQQGFNGLFQENSLADPTTVVQCFDPTTAQNVVAFVNTNLPKAANGSISDLMSLIKAGIAFGDTIPQSVKDCLNTNQELSTLGLKYGIDDNTSPASIEAKVASYVTFHYPALHKAIQGINSQWSASNYFQAGYQAGVLGHNVLSSADQTAIIA